METANYSIDNFRNYGQIAPNEDPDLIENEKKVLQNLTEISDDNFQTMQDSAKNQDTFNKSLHLPKGVFSPTSSEFNSNKPTIVISFCQPLDLGNHFLKINNLS